LPINKRVCPATTMAFLGKMESLPAFKSDLYAASALTINYLISLSLIVRLFSSS
jgi:hypothetical protein